MTFYFACQRATLYIIQSHQYWRTWCTDKFLQRFRTALTNPIHVSTHYLLLTKPWPSLRPRFVRELCTFTHAECVVTRTRFFPRKIPAPKLRKMRQTCLQELISFLFTVHYVNLRLKYVWFSGYPTDNPYLTSLKDFPVPNLPKPRATRRALLSSYAWAQLWPEHEINLRGAPDPAGTYDRCDQRRLGRACVFAQSRQGLAH